MPSDKSISMDTNANVRVVLPHSSCPPRRRVVLPSSNKNTASSQGQNHQCQPHRKTVSKPAESTKEFQEYMEDMEFKIRYMRNDIEFKQSQMQSQELSSAQTRNSSSHTNSSSAHRNYKLTTSKSISDKTNMVVNTCSHKNIPQHTHKKVMPKYSCFEGSHTSLTTYSNSVPSTASTFRKFDNNLRPPTVFSLSKTCNARNSVGSVQSLSHSTNGKVVPVLAKSNNVFTVEDKSSQSTNVPTTSVFQRLGESKTTTSPALIYVSPSKTQAIWSHSTNKSVDHHSTNSISRKNLAQSLGLCKTQNGDASTLPAPVAAASKYKLVKPKFPPTPATMSKVESNSSSCSQRILHSHNKSTPSKTVMKTPKSKVSRKFVSKYKMTRLSPKSASKVSEKLKHIAPENASNSSNIISTPSNKFPKRENVMAAKLVSKYKLKRLVLSTGSSIPPSSLSLQAKPQGITSLPTSVDFKDKVLSHDKQVNHFSSTAANTPSNVHRKSTQLFEKLNFSQHKGVSYMSGHSATRQQFVLDKRNRLRSESQKRVNNRHKLDRRPRKSSSSEHLSKGTGHMAMKRSKHRWISPAAQGSPSSTVARKKQIFNSRFKWRQPLSAKTNPRDSCFKWSRQRFLAGHDMWHQKDERNAQWMTKPNLVMIKGVVYSSKWEAPPYKTKNHALSRAGPQKSNMKLITLRGAHFHADFQGKKLCRAGIASTDHHNKSPRHTLRRSRSQGKAVDESTILAASRVVQRSIVMATAKFKRGNTKWKREKQHCMFFTRFGKCHRGENCKFVHDPEKIAVCTRFLRGKCDETRCQFSHNASEHKMPVCLHYLQGLCSRENCPYLHVRVNPDAPVCKDFHHGYCFLGKKCKKLHSLVCPIFAVTGQCSRGESCSLLHRRIRKEHARQDTSRKFKAKARVQCHPGNEQASEVSACPSVEPRPCEKSNSKSIESNTSDDLQSRLQVQNTNKSQAQCLKAAELRKSKEIGVDVTQPITSSLTTSPKKGSAPLASQPSFISLHSDSPAVSNLQMSSSDSIHRRELESGLNIKPLFIARKLHEQVQDKVIVSNPPSQDTHSSSRLDMARSITVPTPAFLSSKMYKGNIKQ